MANQHTAAQAAAKSQTVDLPIDILKPERKLLPLPERRCELREFKQEVYVVYPERSTQPQDLLLRDYWAHNAARIRVPAKIVAISEDLSWYAELIVVAKFTTSLTVRFLPGYPMSLDLDSIPRPEDDYVVADGGLHRGFEVVRKRDGAVIYGGGRCRTPDEAQAWLRDYQKSAGNTRIAA